MTYLSGHSWRDKGSALSGPLSLSYIIESRKTSEIPRQSVGGGKFIQKRLRRRSPLLKTTGLMRKLTFGDPLLDSVVVMSTPHLLTLDWAAAVAPGYMTLGK